VAGVIPQLGLTMKKLHPWSESHTYSSRKCRYFCSWFIWISYLPSEAWIHDNLLVLVTNFYIFAFEQIFLDSSTQLYCLSENAHIYTAFRE